MMIARVQSASTSSRMWVEMMIALRRRDRPDQRAHLVFLIGIEPVGGLVQDQHVRIVHQRLGDAHPALEALGQGIDALVPDLAEVDALDQLAQPRVGLALDNPCMAATKSRNAPTLMSA